MPLLLLAYLGFASLGLPDGMLGVAWPSMRSDFDAPVNAVSLLLVTFTAGFTLSGVVAGSVIARIGVGWLLAGSTTAASLALTGFAVSPGLFPAIAAALLLGLGSGAIDAGLNAYAARSFGPRHMNWMHASYGLGAMVGPLVVTAAVTLIGTWRAGYAAVAAGQLLLATAFAWTVRAWQEDRWSPGSHSRHRTAAPARATLRLPATWLGMTTFAWYVGIEVGTGLWAFLFLTTARGLDAPAAGTAVSAYWAALFVGRLLIGMVADRIGVRRVLWLAIAGLAAGAALITVPTGTAGAVVGLMVIGLAAAPVFPLLMLTTSERVGPRHADRVVGLQVSAAAVGGTALPAGIGQIVQTHGAPWLGPCLLVLAAALAGTYATALRSGRRTGDDPPASR